MNFTLLKQGIKSNWKLFSIFAAVMLMYMSVIIAMFDPATQESAAKLMEAFPKEIFSAMGFSFEYATTLEGFLAGYYYGFIILLFPMIFIIILANKLVAKQVDRGSMAYLLSTPNTRTKIVVTQAVFLVSSTLTLLLIVAISGIGFGEIMFPGKLDFGKFWLMNIGAMALFIAISGISFLCSCMFNDSKMSLSFGAGIPLGFYIISMLANVGDKFSWLQYFTIFTLYKAENIIKGDSNTALYLILLAVIGVMAYVTGIGYYKKKDLPL